MIELGTASCLLEWLDKSERNGAALCIMDDTHQAFSSICGELLVER